MEDVSKDESATSATANLTAMRSKLRYPLRSASKAKEEKVTTPETSISASVKRSRTVSSVSKSMNVLDLSGKEKSAKPPRRQSIPTKTPTSVSKTIGNITPIYEIGVKRSIYGQGKNDTPASDVSRSGTRKRFSILSSASYWLSQIKLSESASRHSISLGFFKLALEAGCEPIQRMRDELKAYARRHNLVELGEIAKEVFEGYNISENLVQPQVSETVSQVPEEGTRSSDDDILSTSSTMGTGKLQPKSLNVDALQTSAVTEPATKTERSPKPNSSSKRTKASLNKVSVGVKPIIRNTENKPQKPTKQESIKGKNTIKKNSKKGASEEVNPSPAEETVEENKENMGASPAEEIVLAEVI